MCNYAQRYVDRLSPYVAQFYWRGSLETNLQQNYHWWWQSFLVGGSSSIWIFGYLLWYYFTKLHITGFVSSLLFFCYGFLACGVYGLLTSTIGFLSAYAFVRRIYG